MKKVEIIDILETDKPIQPEIKTTKTWQLEKEMTKEEEKEWHKMLEKESSFESKYQDDRKKLMERLEEHKQREKESVGNEKIRYQILAYLLEEFVYDMFPSHT